jgi:6-phospho-beta-glucosidase
MIDAAGAHPLTTDPLPAEIRGLVQAVKAYEELAAAAGAEGDRRMALLALLAHPLTPSYRTAQGLLEALLDAHQQHLPQFFSGG